jgi:uncharacterized protein (UPF0335 family)
MAVKKPSTTTVGGIAGESLKQYIERIERLEEEKKTIAEDVREVFAEAKGNGFDAKIMRKVISLRKMDASERDEQETLIDLYKAALGMTGSADEKEAA